MGLRLSATAVALLAVACATNTDGTGRGRDGGGVTPIDGGPRRDGGGGGGCTPGERVACTTTCGSAGTALCTGGLLGECTPPIEDCNGADEDCDGTIDEGIGERACTMACGGGVTRCVDGAFTPCMGGTPSPETCEGTDQDCDGRIDETLSRPCMTACGAGTETCAAGTWGACGGPMPLTETCNGADQDCDGRVDEGVVRPCSTACGGGMETCTAGTFGGCTAPVPGAEICNLMDEDCDGETDEGFGATILDGLPIGDVTAFQPPCTSPSAGLDVCMSAARRYCLARPCYTDGGAGFLAATGGTGRIVCFTGVADEHNTTFAAVSAASSITVTGSNIYTRVAQSAVNRYCRSRGSAAGVGPTEHADPNLTVTCLPASIAETVSIATSDLGARSCNPVADPNTFACSVAADSVCRARGYTGGYGPVEWNTTDSAVVCFLSG